MDQTQLNWFQQNLQSDPKTKVNWLYKEVPKRNPQERF